MKPEQECVRNILLDTVTLLCKNSLNFKRQLKVQGLLGITLDDDEVFLVHINEQFQDNIGASSVALSGHREGPATTAKLGAAGALRDTGSSDAYTGFRNRKRRRTSRISNAMIPTKRDAHSVDSHRNQSASTNREPKQGNTVDTRIEIKLEEPENVEDEIFLDMKSSQVRNSESNNTLTDFIGLVESLDSSKKKMSVDCPPSESGITNHQDQSEALQAIDTAQMLIDLTESSENQQSPARLSHHSLQMTGWEVPTHFAGLGSALDTAASWSVIAAQAHQGSQNSPRRKKYQNDTVHFVLLSFYKFIQFTRFTNTRF